MRVRVYPSHRFLPREHFGFSILRLSSVQVLDFRFRPLNSDLFMESRIHLAALCFFTQSRMMLFVSSGACQKKPCDCPLRTLSSAPGILLARTSDCAM